MADYAGLVSRLRGFADEGHAPAEVMGWLHDELRLLGSGRVSSFTFTHCLTQAFGMDFEIAQRVRTWVRLGWGGSMSDGELNELLAGRLETRN